MFEDFKKSVDKGIEYAFMNAEKIAQAAKGLAKENKLTAEEAKKLYEHLVAKSEEAKKTVESELHHLVKNVLKKMEVPTAEDMKKLQDRIAKLEGANKTTVKSKTSSRKAASTSKPVKKTGKPE
jgi:polyhydroxyalkanoate synthesis regulator phasin